MERLKQVAESKSHRRYSDTIRYFNKTPRNICCPHFWILSWAFGCPFQNPKEKEGCQWCYLIGTSFGRPTFRAYDIDQVLKHTKEALNSKRNPVLFNAGELSDSFVEHPYMRAIMDLFDSQRRHKLLLLTKGADVRQLVKDAEAGKRRRVIYSCTLNATSVAERWEVGIPTPTARLKALREVGRAGVETRCRIDPVVPIDGWEKEYARLVDEVCTTTSVERVTVGTLRGLQRTINFANKLKYDTTWTEYLEEQTGWGKKMKDELRYEIYDFLVDRVKSYGVEVGICKETTAMVKRFGWNRGNLKCNCVL